MDKLFILKRTSTAKVPTKAHDGDAGYDLYSDEDVIIPANDRAVISTGITIKVPDNCYGRIASRSGLSCISKIDVGAGVVDKKYRGQVCVCLINSNNFPFTITKGMKIAQLVCEIISYPELCVVDSLDDTDRGESGFGSSGL
jgi:dUTP pyrophosphatase